MAKSKKVKKTGQAEKEIITPSTTKKKIYIWNVHIKNNAGKTQIKYKDSEKEIARMEGKGTKKINSVGKIGGKGEKVKIHTKKGATIRILYTEE